MRRKGQVGSIAVPYPLRERYLKYPHTKHQALMI